MNALRLLFVAPRARALAAIATCAIASAIAAPAAAQERFAGQWRVANALAGP
jgi:hypothetical protein